MNGVIYNQILDTIESQMSSLYDYALSILEDSMGQLKVETKILVLVKIKLLQKYIEILYDDDSNNFFKDVELINKNTSNLYLEILEELFESQGKYNQETFNQLWDRILSINKVDERSHYFYAKIKAFAIWKSLDEVYTFGDAFIAEEYHIKPDQIVDELPIATCHNERLDTLHKILQSIFLPPVSHTWEDSLEPADFLLTIRKPLQTQEAKLNETVSWNIEDLTLSDLWQHHRVGSTLSFPSLIRGLNNNWIHREVAGALTKLYWGFTRIIPANRLGHKLDTQHKENISTISETIKEALKDPLESINKNIEAVAENFSQEINNEPSTLWEQVGLKAKVMSPIPELKGVYKNNYRTMEKFHVELRLALINYLEEKGMPSEEAYDKFFLYYPSSEELARKVYRTYEKPYKESSWAATRRFKMRDEK
ncbi:MAG TPA: hypothetical protein GXZ38_04380 [Spirochaetales bacterium]|jgi:hypothetical protein|nr:hypothetical protein [Spirochaetales bacterium]